jgi:hypothetical protein
LSVSQRKLQKNALFYQVYSKYEEKQHPTPSPSLKGKELIEGIPE